jgi:hypothetical protein
MSLHSWLAIIACAVVETAFIASAQESQNRSYSPDVVRRADELRREFSVEPSARHAAAARAEAMRQTTVRALIKIVEDEGDTEVDHRLATLALHELGLYPDSKEGIRFLVKCVEFRESWAINSNPIGGFTAANALIRIGLPARRMLIPGGATLSDENLQLRSYILATLDGTDSEDDFAGQSIAIYRLTRHLERLTAEVVPAELEQGKRAAVRNVQRVIALLTNPSLMAIQIPHTPPMSDARREKK